MKGILTCVLGAGLCLSAPAADTKVVTVGQLPPAVQAAIKQQTAGATIIGASRELEQGRMTYEVETKRDGKGRDLAFDKGGSLLAVEEEVDLESIPEASRKAIQKKVAGGTIRKVECVRQKSTTSYEVDVRAKDGKNREIVVNADGSTHSRD